MTCLRVLIFTLLAMQLFSDASCRLPTEEPAIRAADGIECSGISAETVQLEIGKKRTFHSQGYPTRFPRYNECSRKLKGPEGSVIDLKCEVLHLTSWATFYVVDQGQITVKKCLFCRQEKFAHKFRSNEAEVGLQSFLCAPKGFSCTVEAVNVNQCECGVVNTGTSRIIGGTEAEENEFPWMGRMVVVTQNSADIFRCGASLISDSYVLTAAHCTSNVPAADLRIQFGVHNVTQLANVKVFQVEEKIEHPQYNSASSFDKDVALLKLKTPVDFSSKDAPYIRPICLAKPGEKDYTFDWATVAGFGVLENIDLPSTLRKVTVPVFPFKQCQELAPTLQDLNITQNMICAGGLVPEKGMCFGDAGSALFTKANDGGVDYMEQIGIASFVLDGTCQKIGQPDIYTRITAVHDWIQENIADSKTCPSPS